MPTLKQTYSASEIGQFEAVRLFIDRAVNARPNFTLTEANADSVAQLCRCLDGIPLALELAAARVRSMNLTDILGRLDDRFRFLNGGNPAALPRQQTLKALIDWSYDLLTPTEKLLLARLSVFVGGWDLSACEVICGGESLDDWDVLDVLSSLVDKSLVNVSEASGRNRYRMLETVREYGWQRLKESRDEMRILRKHRVYFISTVEERRSKSVHWLDALHIEYDNLRSALSEGLLATSDVVEAMQLASGLFEFWLVRSEFTEGRSRLSTLLDHPLGSDRTKLRADTLSNAGVLAYNVGDHNAARDYHTEALSIRRQISDWLGIAISLNNLGNIARDFGEYESAESFFHESLSIRQEIADTAGVAVSLTNLGLLARDLYRLEEAESYLVDSLEIKRSLGDEYGVANTLNGLGLVRRDQGRLDLARMAFRESFDIRQKLGNRSGMAMAINNLGRIAQLEEDFALAETSYRESLAIKVEIGDQRGILYSLEMIASLMVQLERYELAAIFWGAAEGLREGLQASMPRDEKSDHDAAVKVALDHLDGFTFDAAWNRGRNLTQAEVLGLLEA
jgi:non-specific serine/threonine protein kinase